MTYRCKSNGAYVNDRRWRSSWMRYGDCQPSCQCSRSSTMHRGKSERWQESSISRSRTTSTKTSKSFIRYDTVDLRALKSWRDGQLNPAHGTETKKNEKLKTKNEKLRRNGPGNSPCKQSGRKKWNYRGVGLAKHVGFKPGVKERRS